MGGPSFMYGEERPSAFRRGGGGDAKEEKEEGRKREGGIDVRAVRLLLSLWLTVLATLCANVKNSWAVERGAHSSAMFTFDFVVSSFHLLASIVSC